MRDLGALLTVLKNIVVGAKTNGTVNGATFDSQPYDGVTAILHVEAWTDGTHTPKLQDSPDNSIWTDVVAANLIGAFTPITSNANVGTKQKVTYVGAQRYQRTVLTTTGATTGAIIGSDIIGGFGRKVPQA
jgi:hypothetical protein